MIQPCLPMIIMVSCLPQLFFFCSLFPHAILSHIRYAVHNAGVSFTLKKFGEPGNDVHTNSSASQSDAIRLLYGAAVATELLEVKCEDETLKFSMAGLTTNANFNTKRANLLLFINNRLVHCSSLKRALDSLYAAHLPKHTFYFAYMSLTLAPENVDVNVHPTKSEVHVNICIYYYVCIYVLYICVC